MLHMQSLNNLIRAEVLDHIDPDTCTSEDRMRAELEVLEAFRKEFELRVERQRGVLIAEGFAFYAEHLRESAPSKTWWLENAPEQWPMVCRVAKVRAFKLK
jgi:hypothetical protein